MSIFSRFFFREKGDEESFSGRGLAPGIGMGTTVHMKSGVLREIPRLQIQRENLGREFERISRAMNQVKEDLEGVCRSVESTFDVHTAAIFRAQQAMLEDSSVRRHLEAELDQSLVNGEEVVRRVFESYEQRMRNTGNEVVAARSDDIADLSRRIIVRMGGSGLTAMNRIPPGSIIVATRLFPSDTATLSGHGIEGMIVEEGSKGSHLALIAKEMGVPLVSGIRGIFTILPEGEKILVDGDHGTVFLRPAERTIFSFRKRSLEGREIVARERMLRHRPLYTANGREISVNANVGTLEDATRAKEFGAQGIGLFRIEQLYLSRDALPSNDELVSSILETIRPFQGKPVNIRLLDVGGDKRLPYLELPEEANPFLGRRGVRLLLHYPDLLKAELWALVQVHRSVPIRILVPMVSFADELVQIREFLMETGKAVGVDLLPEVGAMIETPAAALCASEIASVADFLSIGTNDLTQYTLAADRDNPLVSDYYRVRHPSVLTLIRSVVEQACGKPVSVCGDSAGDLDSIEEILSTGIANISVAPPLIPHVKNRIRKLQL